MSETVKGPDLRQPSPVACGAVMDPRVARTTQAVMDTATDLLVEGGPQALTMDAVVARSGVAKSTIYRHWETRDALVAAVFDHCAPGLALPADDVPCEEALRALVGSVAVSMADESWAQLAPALMLLSRQHPELKDLDSEMKKRQHEATEAVLRNGVAEGVLHPSVLDEVSATIALIAGPVIFAGLSGMAAVDAALAERSVDQFLAHQRELLAH